MPKFAWGHVRSIYGLEKPNFGFFHSDVGGLPADEFDWTKVDLRFFQDSKISFKAISILRLIFLHGSLRGYILVFDHPPPAGSPD